MRDKLCFVMAPFSVLYNVLGNQQKILCGLKRKKKLNCTIFAAVLFFWSSYLIIHKKLPLIFGLVQFQ